ncbi:MAG: extracellular solute-binding protein [Ardenticatenia bacterium]|nr:MAG: extracellular solute-binding protein [Ardenticatenia bacterium]
MNAKPEHFPLKTYWLVLLSLFLLTLSACNWRLGTPSESAAEPSPAMSIESVPSVTPEPEIAEVSAIDPTGRTITLWHALPPRETEALQTIVHSFNTTNPWAIQVELNAATDTLALEQRILATIQTNEHAELVIGADHLLDELQEADMLTPIRPFLNDPRWALSEEDQSALYLNAFPNNSLTTPGGALHVPLNIDVMVLAYNRELMSRLEIETPPTTWAEFEAQCLAFVEQMQRPCLALQPNARTLVAIGWTFGVDLLNVEQVQTDDDALQTFLGFLFSLGERGMLNVVTDQNPFDRVAQGETLFALVGTAQLGDEEEDGIWSATVLPTLVDEPPLPAWGPTITLLNTTPEQTLAGWLFVRWYLTTPTAQQAFAARTHLLPVHQEAVEALKNDERVPPGVRRALLALPETRSLHTTTTWEQFEPVFSNIAIGIFTQSMIPNEALGILRERIR